MDYEYCLYTWGGFYNEEYWCKHQQSPGAHYFKTAEDRDRYENSLRSIESEMSAYSLMTVKWEGRDARFPITCHRTIRVNGFEITTHYDVAPIRTLEGAVYILEHKWYPGVNDEPFGEDFDYSTVKIVNEWVTGPFDTWYADLTK